MRGIVEQEVRVEFIPDRGIVNASDEIGNKHCDRKQGNEQKTVPPHPLRHKEQKGREGEHKGADIGDRQGVLKVPVRKSDIGIDDRGVKDVRKENETCENEIERTGDPGDISSGRCRVDIRRTEKEM